MFFSKERGSSSEYALLALHADDEDSIATPENRSSSSSLVASDNLSALAPSKPSQPPKLILYFSFALALLSAANIALFPATLSQYQAYPLSDSELEALPYGDARLGLDRAAKMIPTPQVYHQAWPDRIARVSRKLKNAVWGQGVQVYVTVEVRMSILPSSSFIPFNKPSNHFSAATGMCAAADARERTRQSCASPSPPLASTPARSPGGRLPISLRVQRTSRPRGI